MTRVGRSILPKQADREIRHPWYRSYEVPAHEGKVEKQLLYLICGVMNRE